MLTSKALLRKAERDIPHEVNTFECDSLAKSWTSPDFLLCNFEVPLKESFKSPRTSTGSYLPRKLVVFFTKY